MTKQYAEKEFLDFLTDKFFADILDGQVVSPDEGPTIGEIIDYMRNNDSGWEGTYKGMRESFEGEFQKYKADPSNYKVSRP